MNQANLMEFKKEVCGERLLINKQDDKVKELLRRYQKNTKKGTPRDIENATDEEIAERKVHYTEDGKVGFPVAGFKKGIMAVAPKLGLYKSDAESIQILGNLTEIKYKKRLLNKAWGRTQGMKKTPIECIRAEFTDWSTKLTIKYNADIITPENIMNLLNWAGFHRGLGDWRPEKGGSYGMYQVKPRNENIQS